MGSGLATGRLADPADAASSAWERRLWPLVLRWGAAAEDEVDAGVAAALLFEGAAALWETQSPKILSAAASVGSSRRAAEGVPVRDRERRVDLPKEPVSATPRRARTLPGRPSCLDGSLVNI